MNRYEELRQRQQKEFDALPLGFAFGDKQFEEMMKEWGLDAKKKSDLDKIYSIGYGGYIQKKDAPLLHETRKRHDKEMEDAIAADETGEGFVFEMFLYELDNHEYGYTGDPEGALDALGYTADEVMENPKLKCGLKKAIQFIGDRENDKRTVTFMAAKNGSCEDLYRCKETGKVYIRQQCDKEHVRWLTTSPCEGSYEADSHMRKGLVIRAVDKADTTLFVEELIKDEGMDSTWAVKDGPFSWEAIKALSEEVRSQNDLTAYEEWKAWLLADMPEDAKIYPDDWCFAMTDRGPVKKLARMDFLGVTVFATSQELKHSACGKSWVIYEIRDADLTSCLALCGFKYENLALDNAKRIWTTKHTENVMSRVHEAEETLGLAEKYMGELGRGIDTLSRIKLTDRKVMEFMAEFFPVTADLPDVQRKNNLRLLEDMKRRYWDAPDLSNVGKNGYRFVNAISDFATHADPIRRTKNYDENLFLRTVEGNPMIDRAYKMVLAAA